MTDVLQTPLQFIKGVGPRRAEELANAGLEVLSDLLLRLPLRYEDRHSFQKIEKLKSGEIVTVVGNVLSSGMRITKRRSLFIFEALIGDSTGQIRAVFFNQSFLKSVLTVHQKIILFGKVDYQRFGKGLQFTNPQFELLEDESEFVDDELIHIGRIVPIYEKVGKISPKTLRRIVYAGLKSLPEAVTDCLPIRIADQLFFPDRREAFYGAHFPEPGTSIDQLNKFCTPAQKRLIFEEFFVFQLGLALKRRETDKIRKPRTIYVDARIRQAALDVLPFRLTDDQKRSLKEIVTDLQHSKPMNRLLQGDVGSGKTIVALLASLVAMENGLQVAVMSPTEILAEQHYLNISRLLRLSRFKTALLTGSMGVKMQRQIWNQISSGAVQFIVGTHALVQEAVKFKSLGLVVIDEQHRFGVLQRETLRVKGLSPDVLVMTATPIPRTLALTAYGDLDISLIRELPPGRHRIKTSVYPESGRNKAYELVKKNLDLGRQGYVVCPLVEESEKIDLKAATEMAEHLDKVVFRDYRVGLVHGRMNSTKREKIMRGFYGREIDLLVATTVVEVGVDVPNASMMLVEHAERFGLSQLHQLRGRVGRGSHESFCLLLHKTPLSDSAKFRLNAISTTNDGFEIAERDLELRGPGDFFGTRQSGVPILRVGDLVRDYRLMEEARQSVQACLTSGQVSDHELNKMTSDWSKRFRLVEVG